MKANDDSKQWNSFKDRWLCCLCTYISNNVIHWWTSRCLITTAEHLWRPVSFLRYTSLFLSRRPRDSNNVMIILLWLDMELAMRVHRNRSYCQSTTWTRRVILRVVRHTRFVYADPGWPSYAGPVAVMLTYQTSSLLRSQVMSDMTQLVWYAVLRPSFERWWVVFW